MFFKQYAIPLPEGDLIDEVQKAVTNDRSVTLSVKDEAKERLITFTADPVSAMNAQDLRFISGRVGEGEIVTIFLTETGITMNHLIL